MASQWDEVTGAEPFRPGPHKNPRQPRQRTRSQPQSKAQPQQQRPADVSARVWGLAEQFLEEGQAACGAHLPINKVKFARRLSDRINGDKEIQDLLRHRGPDWVNDLVSDMIQRFWTGLQEGAHPVGVLQFVFLDEDWPDLLEDARVNANLRIVLGGLETGETAVRGHSAKFAAYAERKRQEMEAAKAEQQAVQEEYRRDLEELGINDLPEPPEPNRETPESLKRFLAGHRNRER